MPVETSPDQPLPVRRVSQMLGEWIDRLGWIWVEGQITQVGRRPGMATAFLTLRDPAADLSLSITAPTQLLDSVDPPAAAGTRVVLRAKPNLYLARGSLSLRADDIRHVGLGELLARLERLKQQLAAEGLFDAERKRTLPFIPGRVGLVCGRGSAAERDVLDNARRRWPGVHFDVRGVAVQGPYAVAEVVDAITALDTDRTVDVIVVTRGGGSVEDLLPFSDETMIRAVARAATPIVSAIGHETDAPLLDLVADVRASTPTDAARRVVPDLVEEQAQLTAAQQRLRRLVDTRLDKEQAWLDATQGRPSLATPTSRIDAEQEGMDRLRRSTRQLVSQRLSAASDDLAHSLARVRALSPRATLQRGYALVQRQDGYVVRAADDAPNGTLLRIRLAADEVSAESRGGP